MEYGLVLLWLLAYLGLGALALPATAVLFERFPGKGAGLALPVALATLGVVGYWVGQVRFGYPALVAGLAALAVLSGVALYRGVRPDPREYGEAMAVFAVAFLFLVAIRAYDPAVHPGGGEKFLDFGLLNSLLRTGRLPPEDIWFAGDAMPYYYGGHMITALLSWLTDTAPRYSYNLALAGWYGTFVTAAYALAGSIADRTGRPRRTAGLVAAFFVGVASNLVTPLRFLAWTVPGGGTVAGAVGVDLSGLAEGSFEYWSAHLVIPGTNNEFPLFAFLNGDMHAHMMSPTFTLLLGGALLAYWWTPDDAVWRRRAIVLGVVPPLGGLIALVNTWSLPTVGGLTFLALAFAPAPAHQLLPAPVSRAIDGVVASTPRADGGTPRSAAAGTAGATAEARPEPATAALREGVRVASALGAAGVATVLGAALVFPYMAMSTAGRGVGFVDGQSGLWGLLLVHGVFLGITGVYVLPRLDPGEGYRGRAFVLLSILVAVLALAGVAAVVPFVVVLGGAWLLARADDRTDFEAVLAVGAMGLVVLVEFFRVTNAGPGRYNTVFKFYAQVWALWAVAAGVVLAGYVDPAGYVRGLVGELRGDDPDHRAAVEAARPTYAGVLAAALVLSLSLYGGFAMDAHFEEPMSDDGATLDALGFVDENHPEEAEAIRWVRDLEGQPNIVSAPTSCMYQWTSYVVDCGGGTVVGASAAASLTGVPTLAGWYHEIGYRGEDEFLSRVRDVRTIYDGTPTDQARLLAEHEVEYVYVGPAERERYENVDFDRRLEGVEVAHESGEVVVYRVDLDRVAPDESATAGPGPDEGDEGDDGGSPPRGGTGSGSNGPTG